MEMSFSTPYPFDSPGMGEEIENSNSILDGILKMKQQRLKILQEFNKQHEDEMIPLMKDVQFEEIQKKETSHKVKRKSLVAAPIRRSQRIIGKSEEEPQSRALRTAFERPPNHYGAIPGVEVGQHWDTRMECSYDGVHRPTVAGIHSGPYGAYSIALSGGYPEDVDEGNMFTYTGSGGRDLKGTAMKPKNLRTAPQTKNQELEGSNFSLVKNINSGRPVRVIRGYKLNSIYAPETGYRYDGLYNVVKYWEDRGSTGFRIYRFEMVRAKDQAPPPWERGRRRGTPRRTESGCSSPETSNPSDSDHSPTKRNVIDSIEGKSETELDEEIRLCRERLCRSSLLSPDFYDDLKRDAVAPDSAFPGWD